MMNMTVLEIVLILHCDSKAGKKYIVYVCCSCVIREREVTTKITHWTLPPLTLMCLYMCVKHVVSICRLFWKSLTRSFTLTNFSRDIWQVAKKVLQQFFLITFLTSRQSACYYCHNFHLWSWESTLKILLEIQYRMIMNFSFLLLKSWLTVSTPVCKINHRDVFFYNMFGSIHAPPLPNDPHFS